MIRCGRIPHRFSKEENKSHPKIEGFVNINVTSGNRGKYSNLSPMKIHCNVIEILAPNEYYSSGILPGFQPINNQFQITLNVIFENYWQFAKIYDVDLIQNIVQQKFFIRRGNGLHLDKPKRRALPKKEGTPVASFFNGGVYNYLESRFYVYCPKYAELIRNMPELQDLVNLHKQGVNLHIIGYDGRDVPITKESMDYEIRRTDVPFGHELVICCLLAGLEPWKI